MNKWRRPPRAHCVHGHLLSGDNVHVAPNGWRYCRTCQADRDSRRKHPRPRQDWWVQWRINHREEYRAYHRQWQATTRWRRRLLEVIDSPVPAHEPIWL